MKTLTFTYDTNFYDNEANAFRCGETCMDITITDALANVILASSRFVDNADGLTKTAQKLVEKFLSVAEDLKSRIYVTGSVKDIREVREDI